MHTYIYTHTHTQIRFMQHTNANHEEVGNEEIEVVNSQKSYDFLNYVFLLSVLTQDTYF